MTTKFLSTILVIAAMLHPQLTQAQADSAYMLAMECNHAASGVASTEAGICIRYLVGVTSGANIDRDIFCPQRSMILGQVATHYAQYFEAHSELASENRITAAYHALKAIMPCGRGGNPPIPPRRPSDAVDPRDTAYALMVECNVIDNNPVACMNFLIGVVEGANIDRQMFCPKAGSAPLLPYIYQKYARAHSELTIKHRMQVVRAAFEEAFPCDRDPSKGNEK